MKSIHRTLLAAAIVAALGVSVATQSAPPGPSFDPAQKVTPFEGFGYEPAVVVDRFGNIMVTAHKENWQLAAAPDVNSPTYTRSMSWAWLSTDDGATFGDMPGWTSLSAEQHDFGDEGDLALDDAGHVYFVDTNVLDATFTRWKSTGRGALALESHRPLIPALQAVDDRPWVTAHGDGKVFYFGNEGDKVTYPNPGGCVGKGGGCGAGRYTVYASSDAGETFDSIGTTLLDSGWCRPAADHAPGSTFVYLFCGNDGGSDGVVGDVAPVGTLWSFVSADDGKTWERYQAGDYQALDSTASWPTVVVSPDGSVWALYVDATALDGNNDPVGNRLRLFHSLDHGRTWKEQDITPRKGRYEYGWLAVSRDGKKLGLGVYYKPDAASAWRAYGATWKPGQIPSLVSLDETNPVTAAGVADAPGDLMSSDFGPSGNLSVVWTRYVFRADAGVTSAGLARDIYHARSR